MAKLNREYIAEVWYCDYCGKMYEGKNLGFRKKNYTLCKDCKHMSIKSIEERRK